MIHDLWRHASNDYFSILLQDRGISFESNKTRGTSQNSSDLGYGSEF